MKCESLLQLIDGYFSHIESVRKAKLEEPHSDPSTIGICFNSCLDFYTIRQDCFRCYETSRVPKKEFEKYFTIPAEEREFVSRFPNHKIVVTIDLKGCATFDECISGVCKDKPLDRLRNGGGTIHANIVSLLADLDDDARETLPEPVLNTAVNSEIPYLHQLEVRGGYGNELCSGFKFPRLSELVWYGAKGRKIHMPKMPKIQFMWLSCRDLCNLSDIVPIYELKNLEYLRVTGNHLNPHSFRNKWAARKLGKKKVHLRVGW
jgi:hypothetical protein